MRERCQTPERSAGPAPAMSRKPATQAQSFFSVSQQTPSAPPAPGLPTTQPGGTWLPISYNLANIPLLPEGQPAGTVIQRSQNQAAAGNTGARRGAHDSTGQPLPDGVRGQMESSFGVDFSQVRVHEGGAATALGALAFARGEHLHFAPGRYDPLTYSGKALIGHELTHVVQQRAGRAGVPQGKADVRAMINADPGLEGEADRLGMRAARGERVAVAGATPGLPPHLQPSRAPGGGIIQRAAVLAGVRDTLDDNDRCKRLMNAAESVSSGMPMKFFVANANEDPGNRNIAEVWDGPGASLKVKKGDHIDVFGHAAEGYPAGLSPAALVAGISRNFRFQGGNWEGDMRIFACYTGATYDNEVPFNDPNRAENLEKTRRIMKIGAAMSADPKLRGVKGIGSALEQGNLGPQTGAVLVLTDGNIKLRTMLNQLTLPQIKAAVIRDYDNIGNLSLVKKAQVRNLFDSFTLTVMEKKAVRECPDLAQLKAMIYTAYNRYLDSGWQVASKDNQGRWHSQPRALVGTGSAQVKKLKSVRIKTIDKFIADIDPNNDRFRVDTQ